MSVFSYRSLFIVISSEPLGGSGLAIFTFNEAKDGKVRNPPVAISKGGNRG